MRKFVSSFIFSLILTLISVASVFLLQAPLMTFVYYGFLSNPNELSISPTKNPGDIAILIVQIALTLAFIFSLFIFLRKIIHIFLKNEKVIRKYYSTFIFLTLVVPIALILISIFARINLFVLTVLIEAILLVITTALISFTVKILPETTNHSHRKYLFTEGSKDE
ncbi:MAG: hypothetical protein IIU46_02835 [Treponema sp.]|nr:hypothetical protein [Treponema sp.]